MVTSVHFVLTCAASVHKRVRRMRISTAIALVASRRVKHVLQHATSMQEKVTSKVIAWVCYAGAPIAPMEAPAKVIADETVKSSRMEAGFSGWPLRILSWRVDAPACCDSERTTMMNI